MLVTFYRLADHQWAHVRIERDDGVVYRMHAGPVTAELPHDLVHLTVEDALRMSDGIWGAIAGGVVFRSMTHHSGRRPPHAADRSTALIRAYRDRLQRAELIGGFVERLAHDPSLDVARAARESLTTQTSVDLDLAAVPGAVAALHRAEERWRALKVGEELECRWPAYRKMTLQHTR